MAEVKSPKWARETAWYGVSPTDITANIVGAAEEYLAKGLESCEKSIMAEVSKDKHAAVQQGVETVYDRFEPEFHRAMDQFEMYLQHQILKIPDHISLPGLPSTSSGSAGAGAAPLGRTTTADLSALDAELAELQKKIHATAVMNKSLERELRALDSEVSAHESATDVDSELRARHPFSAPLDSFAQDMKSVATQAMDVMKATDDLQSAVHSNSHILQPPSPMVEANAQSAAQHLPLNAQQLAQMAASFK